MEQQIILFGPAHNGTDTSMAAADSIRSARVRLHTKVYCFIEAAGKDGATRDEIEYGLGMAGNTVRPRVRELLELKLICEPTGRWRETRSGRAAQILIAIQFQEGTPT